MPVPAYGIIEGKETYGTPVLGSTQQSIVLPVVAAGNPAPESLKVLGGTNKAYFCRCVTPRAGTVKEIAFYVGKNAGKQLITLYDNGQAKEGEYTQIMEPWEVEPSEENRWVTNNTITAPLPVLTAGQHFFAAIMTSNNTFESGVVLGKFNQVGISVNAAGTEQQSGVVVGRHSFAEFKYLAKLKQSEMEPTASTEVIAFAPSFMVSVV